MWESRAFFARLFQAAVGIHVVCGFPQRCHFSSGRHFLSFGVLFSFFVLFRKNFRARIVYKRRSATGTSYGTPRFARFRIVGPQVSLRIVTTQKVRTVMQTDAFIQMPTNQHTAAGQAESELLLSHL